MTNNIAKATTEQTQKALKLLAVAGLPPETRMECEGMVALGLESQITGLISNLEKLISEKEAAYLEYKNTVKEAISSLKQKPS